MNSVRSRLVSDDTVDLGTTRAVFGTIRVVNFVVFLSNWSNSWKSSSELFPDIVPDVTLLADSKTLPESISGRVFVVFVVDSVIVVAIGF